MTAFTITITDPHQLAGITAARTAYNAAVPATLPDPKTPGALIQDPAALMADDAAYMQFVFVSAAQSYAKQYNT